MIGRLRSVLPRSAMRKAFVYHFAVSVAVLLVTTFVAGLLIREAARQEVIRNANWAGQAIADGLIAPLLTPGVRARDKDELALLDRVVRSRIASSNVVRIKVWAADGTVLYSDATDQIGRRFELDPEDLEVLRNGGNDSELTHADKPENADERRFGDLIEVYVRAKDTVGRPVLVETYFPVKELHARAAQLERRMLPVVLLALVLMELLLLPLSVWLTRRAERSERNHLIARGQAAEAAGVERRRLAAELHDGVIQDLSAVGYALSSVSDELDGVGAARLQGLVHRTADIVRTDIVTLRSLMSSMYVPPEEDIDLAEALRELTAMMSRFGVTAEIGEIPSLPAGLAAPVFQVAREALRNAVKHAGAPAHLELLGVGDELVLTVADRGSGYAPERVGGPESGHLGLSLLHDAAARSGGRLSVESAPGQGTRVVLAVPFPGTVGLGLEISPSVYVSDPH